MIVHIDNLVYKVLYYHDAVHDTLNVNPEERRK